MATVHVDRSQLWLDPKMSQSDCGAVNNSVFAQYTCVMSQSQQEFKYRALCINTFFGSLICLLFSIFVHWIYMTGKLHQVEWDLATISAADFSVEFPIKKDSYQKWYDKAYKLRGPELAGTSPSFALK